jgi:hypothetical protein
LLARLTLAARRRKRVTALVKYDATRQALAEESSPLADLAARINAEHEAVIHAIGRGLDHAINCGRLLIEAKAQLEHGQWLPWLRDHCPASLPERTASHYMRLARGASELEAKSATVADLSVRDALRLLTSPRGTLGTGDNEWYTPARYIDAARSVLGGIDLDPATSEFAQSRIRADQFFTAEDDGLTQEWIGRVWLNPPYAQPLIGQFAGKLIEEHSAGHVTAAIMLTHNCTDTRKTRSLLARCRYRLTLGTCGLDSMITSKSASVLAVS